MLLACLNLSTRVTDADVALMARATARQFRYHAGPEWGRHTPAVVVYGDAAQVPPGAQQIVVLDDADQAGALAYHELGPNGQPYSKVFAGTILDNGGTVLEGQLSVSAAFSHEALEALADPDCSLWSDDGAGNLVAYEACDPVEDESYAIAVRTPDGKPVGVAVSDFVLPAWFDLASAGPWDYLSVLTAPLARTAGGYTINATGGKVTQQWGDSVPEWKREAKRFPAARTARRAKPLTALST